MEIRSSRPIHIFFVPKKTKVNVTVSLSPDFITECQIDESRIHLMIFRDLPYGTST